MRIKIAIDTPAAKARLRKWGGELQKQSHKAVAKALRSEARELRDAVREHVGQQLKVVKKGFVNGFTAKVYDRDKNRLPALHVGSKIHWTGMHEFGGAIAKTMLIPIGGRIGRKRFKSQIKQLMASSNTFFVKSKHGSIILMAVNQKQDDKPLSRFKRNYRQTSGLKRLKRGKAIPIAVLVKKVVLKKRLNIETLVAKQIPRLAIAIEKEVGRL